MIWIQKLLNRSNLELSLLKKHTSVEKVKKLGHTTNSLISETLTITKLMKLFDNRIVRKSWQNNDISLKIINLIKSCVHKVVKNTLKIMQQILQDFVTYVRPFCGHQL